MPPIQSRISEKGGLNLLFALTVKPHIESGRLRAPGIASASRSSSAPDVPTTAEAGVPGFSADAVLGMLTPARTSRPIIDRLHAEVHKTMLKTGALEAMRNVGVEIALSTPEHFGRVIESEMRRWGKVVRTLNLKPL